MAIQSMACTKPQHLKSNVRFTTGMGWWLANASTSSTLFKDSRSPAMAYRCGAGLAADQVSSNFVGTFPGALNIFFVKASANSLVPFLFHPCTPCSTSRADSPPGLIIMYTQPVFVFKPQHKYNITCWILTLNII